MGWEADVGVWTKTANYRRTEIAASFAATALQSYGNPGSEQKSGQCPVERQ